MRTARSHAALWLAGLIPAFVAFQIGNARDEPRIYVPAAAWGAAALAVDRARGRRFPRPTLRPDRMTACFGLVVAAALGGLVLGDPTWYFVPEMLVAVVLVGLALTWAVRAGSP